MKNKNRVIAVFSGGAPQAWAGHALEVELILLVRKSIPNTFVIQFVGRETKHWVTEKYREDEPHLAIPDHHYSHHTLVRMSVNAHVRTFAREQLVPAGKYSLLVKFQLPANLQPSQWFATVRGDYTTRYAVCMPSCSPKDTALMAVVHVWPSHASCSPPKSLSERPEHTASNKKGTLRLHVRLASNTVLTPGELFSLPLAIHDDAPDGSAASVDCALHYRPSHAQRDIHVGHSAPFASWTVDRSQCGGECVKKVRVPHLCLTTGTLRSTFNLKIRDCDVHGDHVAEHIRCNLVVSVRRHGALQRSVYASVPVKIAAPPPPQCDAALALLPRRCFVVRVLRAEGLSARNWIHGSDPYFKVWMRAERCNNVLVYKFKSPVRYDTTDPAWSKGGEFRFENMQVSAAPICTAPPEEVPEDDATVREGKPVVEMVESDVEEDTAEARASGRWEEEENPALYEGTPYGCVMIGLWNHNVLTRNESLGCCAIDVHAMHDGEVSEVWHPLEYELITSNVVQPQPSTTAAPPAGTGAPPAAENSSEEHSTADVDAPHASPSHGAELKMDLSMGQHLEEGPVPCDEHPLFSDEPLQCASAADAANSLPPPSAHSSATTHRHRPRPLGAFLRSCLRAIRGKSSSPKLLVRIECYVQTPEIFSTASEDGSKHTDTAEQANGAPVEDPTEEDEVVPEENYHVRLSVEEEQRRWCGTSPEGEDAGVIPVAGAVLSLRTNPTVRTQTLDEHPEESEDVVPE
eukprot:TRINITY_DN1646_c0_g1_i6.p1 TRINITY_DN1646_c0_g1~~TRINITY_DN1646_c0_g1_i6.p1  ORF type:complete len:746 (-),score=128.25 TRINITY_DN1646_c0_g1_i6:1564-3801(-)